VAGADRVTAEQRHAGRNVEPGAEGATARASLAAPATPLASPKATGAYRLHIWEQSGGLPIAPATDIELDGSALAWEGAPVTAADHPGPLKLRFVTIDPIGGKAL